MEFVYRTKNTCAKIIKFSKNNDIITNVEFVGGCHGNLQALPILVEGMSADDISCKLGSIVCGRRGTSCAQELAKAVMKAKENKRFL